MIRIGWVFPLALLLLAVSIPAFAVFGETPVVNDINDQVNPAISGDTVVWQDYRHRPPSLQCPSAQNCISADIYSKDLVSGTEQRLTTVTGAMDPDVDGQNVVWRNWTTGKIVVHDLGTGTQQNASGLSGTEQMVTPAVSGQVVVWVDYRNSSEYGDIYMRDLIQPSDAPLVTAPTDPAIPVTKKDKRNPDIDGNIVVWEDWTNAYQDQWGWWHNPDIFMVDLTTGIVQPVTTNTSDQYSPTVSGDKVFWQDYRNGNWDIYMKDLTTGIESQVTNRITDESWPAADGDLLVWKDNRNGNEDIFLRVISAGAEQEVTVDPAGQKIPVVSGPNIAWIDNRSGNWDVYRAVHDTVPPVVDSVSPSGLLSTSPTTIGATYSDVGDGIDTASVIVKVNGGELTSCIATASQVDCPISAIPDGNYSITVDVDDLIGNSAVTGTSTFSVDSQAPTVSNVLPAGTLNNSTQTISADYDDGSGSGIDTATVAVLLDGSPVSGCSIGAAGVSCPVSGLSDGNHAVAIGVADIAGNTGSGSGSFDVDTTAPIISGTSPTGEVTSANPSITADFSDPSPGSGIDTASISASLDGEILSGCIIGASGITCNLDGLIDGNHDVILSVDDLAGNPATSTWTFSVAATGPGIGNLVPSNGAVVNNPWTPVAAQISDNGRGIDHASVSVYLDGVDITAQAVTAPGVINYQLQAGVDPGFADQSHTASVSVADLEGQVSQQTWTFTTTSPELKLFHLKTYWPSYAAYTQGMLMVDYRMTNPGTGACRAGEVTSATASGGVVVTGPLPMDLGDIAAGLYSDYNLSYMVPAGIKSFLAVSNASCLDDGGHIYWFAGPPPA